ncbi:hypothetical protein V9T40_006857 [Parthenolecanium corni]|uniref:Major facilitator superfamily (MFS) profile domain-containing protein n=1 Tax=Parthenolecanium corni TaxID=536013 RepID=A0AAN9Y7I1_9HEMI
MEHLDEDLEDNNTEWDLDQVLTELGFGRYQIKNLILFGFLMMFANLFPLSFTLTTADLQYRCLIPECETSETAKLQFIPSWIQDAVPFRDSEPWKCKRYKPLANTTFHHPEECIVSFSPEEVENCKEWVFATDEVTIVNEFGILCENRKWQLSMIGTINNIGQFLGIPLFGVFSDWFGRKPVVIICSLMSAVFGISRGFSSSYFMFTIFEFSDSFFGGVTYSIAFIMGIELVNPEKRPWAVLAVQIFYPFGAVFMGCIAWYFQNWRKLLIVSYCPGLLFILYFWIIPESVRWLHMKGKYAETNAILQNIAKSNNVKLSKKCPENPRRTAKFDSVKEEKFIWKPFVEAFQKKDIFIQLINCSWCWFAVNLVYYGISINSVELVGNKYMNFILTSLVEVPAVIFAVIMLDRIKRRTSQSSAFILSGLTCIISEFIPPDMLVLKMCIYLTSKLLITCSFSIIYVYSAEMFPTNLRSSFSGIASTFGRIGSMIAPQAILFKILLGNHAPALIFGIVAMSAGGLAITFPETFNKKLEDTDGSTHWDLDEALKDLKFGSFHIRILFLVGLLSMFSGMFPLSFTLTAGDLDYRCLVPECENANKSELQYMPSWIRKAVPFKHEKPWKCKRFKPSSKAEFSGNECRTSFNPHEEKDCDKWVFATDEVTIVKEFGIFCEYRKWKLSLLGTINNIGQFLGISLFGMISDRFGRKTVLILCAVTASICGVCRGFSTSYILFAFLEFLGAFFASAIFMTSTTLAIEFVNIKKRPLAVTIINVFFPIGSAIMGCLAWYFRNWRKLLIVSHFPALLFILYFWLIPESVRWLYTKGYIAEVNAVIKNMPGSNNIELSEKSTQRKNSVKCQTSDEDDKKQKKLVPLFNALRKRHILFRLIRCTFLWVTCTLIYYGLSINSVELIGNKYLNFILTCSIDIPAIILTGVILNKIKRRQFQSLSFFLTGIGCIVSELIPTNMIILKLAFYLTSKFAITIAFTIIYVYTAEMFPTEVRQTLSATASTIGRTGSMIAPHTILLKDVFGTYATAVLFGVVSILAGCLATTLPETLNKKLPDTIEQAKFKDDS